MSAPLRAPEPERDRPQAAPELKLVGGGDDPLAGAERGRAEAERAVAELMAVEGARAKKREVIAAKRTRKPLDVSKLTLLALTMVLVYLVQVRPAWMILPIPVNEHMFDYYRESWQLSLESRQQQVRDARVRANGLGALTMPLPVPRAPMHLPRLHQSGYITKGDDYTRCVAKTIGFVTWMIALGGR